MGRHGVSPEMWAERGRNRAGDGSEAGTELWMKLEQSLKRGDWKWQRVNID